MASTTKALAQNSGTNWEGRIRKTWRREKYKKGIRKLFASLESGISITWAIAESWLSSTSVYWRRQDSEFRGKLEEAEWKWLAKVHKSKANLIWKDYRPAVQQELKAKEPDVYNDKIRVKHEWEITHKMDEEQRKNLSSLFEKNGYENTEPKPVTGEWVEDEQEEDITSRMDN